MMKTVRYKLFMAWEHEEEEKWLAEMESQGWHLIDAAGIKYRFEKGEPDKYIYRLEMLPAMPGAPESQEYLQFMEETGAEMIGSYLKWVYFRKENDGTPFEIYSDIDSKLEHFRRIYKLLHTLMTVLSVLLLVDGVLSVFDHSISYFMILPIIVDVMLIYGASKIGKKIKQLEKEKQIYQ